MAGGVKNDFKLLVGKQHTVRLNCCVFQMTATTVSPIAKQHVRISVVPGVAGLARQTNAIATPPVPEFYYDRGIPVI